LNFPGYNPDFPLFFFVLSLRWQSVALLLSPSSVTMSSLDTATPFVYPSSTLFHAQLSLLNLLVTPQQKSVKFTCSFLRKRLSPTLRASDSAFVRRVYGITYTLLLILLLCTKPVSGTFAAALPLHFLPPPVSHPNAALKNSKNSESSRTPLSTLQQKPKPAEPLVGAYFMHHSPIPAFTTSLTSSSPRLTPASPAYHILIILWSAQLFEKRHLPQPAPIPSFFRPTKKAPPYPLHLIRSPPPIKNTPKPKNTTPTDRSYHSDRLHFSLEFNYLIPIQQTSYSSAQN